MPPSSTGLRILLLKENTETGGVHTVSEALAQALRSRGHQCHSQVIRSASPAALWRAAGDADVIVATHNFLPAYVAWLIGRLRHKPMIVWFHGPLQDVLERAQAQAAKRRWLRWLYRRLPWMVFASRQGRDSFLQFMEGQSPALQHLQVIPNPHPDWSPSPPRPGSSQAEFHCGYVGRLSSEKRPELLLDTLTALPGHYRLRITGEGPLEGALKRHAAIQPKERVQWHTFQPATPALYQAHHLTLLTSLYEGCPMAVLESLAAGVPCAGVPIPALQEMLGIDMPYALADASTGGSLARAVLRVNAMPREVLERDMARVLSRYSPQQFAIAWIQLIEQVGA